MRQWQRKGPVQPHADELSLWLQEGGTTIVRPDSCPQARKPQQEREEGGRLLANPDPRPRGKPDNGPFVSSYRLATWVLPRPGSPNPPDQVLLGRPHLAPGDSLLTPASHLAWPKELGGSTELGHIYSSLALLSELLNIEAKLFEALAWGSQGGSAPHVCLPGLGPPDLPGPLRFLGLKLGRDLRAGAVCLFEWWGTQETGLPHGVCSGGSGGCRRRVYL